MLRREFAGTSSSRFSEDPRNLLEVGCAYGFFLPEHASFRSCRHRETSERGRALPPQRIARERGWPTKPIFEKIGYVDVIVLLDVIEHLPHPARETLDLCSRHLSSSGTGDFSQSMIARFSGPRSRVDDPAAAPLVLYARQQICADWAVSVDRIDPLEDHSGLPDPVSTATNGGRGSGPGRATVRCGSAVDLSSTPCGYSAAEPPAMSQDHHTASLVVLRAAVILSGWRSSPVEEPFMVRNVFQVCPPAAKIRKMTIEQDRTNVVIAAYNEAAIIARVVAEVRRAGYRVVVVDDGSKDMTAQIPVSQCSCNQGTPISILVRARLSRAESSSGANGAETIRTFDADGQHNTSRTSRVWSPHSMRRAPNSRWALPVFCNLGAQHPPSPAIASSRQLLCYSQGAARYDPPWRRCNENTDRNQMAHASELWPRWYSGLHYGEKPSNIHYSVYTIAKGQKTGNSVGACSQTFLLRALYR